MNKPDADLRPRTRQRLSEEVRRAQIMKATIEVLAEHGYDGASLAKIAQRAELSKGLILHYFTDKDRLMETVAKTTLVTIREGIAEAIDLTAAVPEIIRSALQWAAGLGVSHAAEMAALRHITTGLRNADGTLKLGLTDYEETYRAQESLFRRGQEEGSLRAFDTRVMAVTYEAAVDTMITYLHEHPETDPRAYAASLADLLLAAMRA